MVNERLTRQTLQLELAPLHGALLSIKWMLSAALGGMVALLLKVFFPH